MKTILRTIFVFIILVYLVGCAGMADLENDVQRLQVENKQLKQKMNYVMEQLNIMLDRLKQEVYPMAQSQSDQLLRIEKLESEQSINRDKIDQNTYKISQVLQQLSDINYRLKPGSSQGSYSSTRSTPGYPSSLNQRSYSTLSPNQIYQTAYADYLKGNYDLAIQGFEEYLKRYSDSNLAASVQYWIGECYYAKGDYKTAISELDKVIINYPKDDKVKNAALKKGFALFELNQTAQGVIIMQQIIREFPHSKQARIAKEKLESLGLKP